MRIKETSTVFSSAQPLGPVEEKRVSSGFAREFSRQKHDSDAAEYEQYLKALKGRILDQGEIVGKKADIAEFYKYRTLISELLNETVSNAYAFSKTSQFDLRGRHKVFALIRKVNVKLDELAAGILKNEAENIKLLSIVDDIRGMIVDLYY